jgi:hypothetical protein
MPAQVRTLFLGTLLAASAGPLAAQAAMSGTVRNDSTGAPIAGVEVLLGGTNHSTHTNDQGRYILSGLPSGTYQAIFRLVGYLPGGLSVRLTTGDTTRANTTLIRSVVVLARVIVAGATPTRGVGMGRAAIADRQRLGFGKLIDTEALRRYDTHLHLDDVLCRDSGVEVQRVRSDGGMILLAYHPTRRNREGKLNCLMSIYYNGALVGAGGVVDEEGSSGTVKPTDLRMFALGGLDAIEVYRSAAQVPTEYGGASAACGVILLWSRL